MRSAPRLERPIKVTASVTASCNQACRHCYVRCGEHQGREELSAGAWRRAIEDAIASGVMSVFFEGGEPLARPDFLEIVEACARRLLVRVRTNGTLVTTERARRLARIGVATVLVDLMGARAETHDWFAGVPGSHAAALRGIRHLLAAGLETQVLVILTRRNAAEIQGVLELAAGLGVGRVGVLRLYPIGRAKDRWAELALSLDEQMAVLTALRPPAGVRLMQSWHPNDANCCWQMAAIDPWGNSIGCSYLREFVNYGSVRTGSLADTWNHPLYQRLRAGEVERACPTCSATQGSRGGCRSTAFAFHGRWDAPDPFDQELNDGVDLRSLPHWMLQPVPRPPD